MKYSIMNTDEP